MKNQKQKNKEVKENVKLSDSLDNIKKISNEKIKSLELILIKHSRLNEISSRIIPSIDRKISETKMFQEENNLNEDNFYNEIKKLNEDTKKRLIEFYNEQCLNLSTELNSL